MQLPFAMLFTASTMLLAGAAGAAELGIGAGSDIPQDFPAQNAGFVAGTPSPAVPDSTPAKPYAGTIAGALGRSLGINLHADLFTFHTRQSATLALTAGGGSSGTILNLKWRMGQ